MRRAITLDALLAAGLFAAGWAAVAGTDTELPPAAVVGLTAAYTLPLALRRRFPVAVPLLCVAVVLVFGLADSRASQPTLPLAVALAAFTLGRGPRPAVSGPAAAVGAAAFCLAVLLEGGTAADLVFLLVLYAVPWACGVALRRRAAHTRAIAERADRVVDEERRRIARELHDVVTHSISIVALQTEAVRRRLRPEQEREARDLESVEMAAREAMAELRRLFGVLRAEGEPAQLEPQPGLAQLDRLLDQTRAAGLEVELSVEGRPVDLTPGMDVAAYRLVQEALTNVRRHAGAARAWVRVHYADDVLDVTVEDDGRGPGGLPGHGLVGMRERAALYGAELHTGRAERGGFRVRARYPLGARG